MSSLDDDKVLSNNADTVYIRVSYLVWGDRNARDRYRDHPHFDATVRFCESWDQPSFDPDYDTMVLEFFEPMVRRLFSRDPVKDIDQL